MNGKELKRAFSATIPVLTGYVVLGLGFGIIMHSAGFAAPVSAAMGAFIYAGSMQYMAVSLLTGAAALRTVALTTLMVNTRHLFYGISMIEKYSGMGAVKPYLIFALTDETYSLVCQDRPEMSDKEYKRFCILVSALDHFYWAASCTLGAFLGSLITVDTSGVEFALTALFITVFTDQWLKEKDHKPALAGLGITLVCLLIFGKESFLIPSMLLITAALAGLKKLGKEADSRG